MQLLNCSYTVNQLSYTGNSFELLMSPCQVSLPHCRHYHHHHHLWCSHLGLFLVFLVQALESLSGQQLDSSLNSFRRLLGAVRTSAPHTDTTSRENLLTLERKPETMQTLDEQQLRVRLVQCREEKTLAFLQLTLFLGRKSWEQAYRKLRWWERKLKRVVKLLNAIRSGWETDCSSLI